ncbi:MAG: D-alanine--D-alanine ligase [Acidobacteria bacterium]|nr:D-alanine--D-alanine ligase [Acidobacteriota bacterium]NIM63571.1 D-alanine--D-alanine ligase [Acidobacteriota bacterium]NIO58433.1 D-alanine--D-alanine ligase [Acidobacteriota bacterium]NIQ29488.1 D-alanine--D-alanine ligase [Acidobacteriota bacterium]NIQ84165.1 D-alanine--D-alanine ligase [Acidobacteriota bacterium]
MGRRVGLMFGGRSVEHTVSVVSARGVASAMADSGRLECVPIAVTTDGRWLDPETSRAVLVGDGDSVTPPPEGAGRVTVVPGVGLELRPENGAGQPLAIDVLFPLIHGWGGEDGRLQGALELAGLAYVGAGVAGSAVGMDKVFARRLFEERGLPVCRWLALERHEFEADPDAAARRIERELGFPVFVKPSNGGSSLGVAKAATRDGVIPALRSAARFDRRLVIESGHDVREIECAVLGNEHPEASILGEIVPSNEFYDFDAKYVDDASELRIPAPLPDELTGRIRKLAVEAYRTLDLAGFARVDFFVERETGEVLLNEVNTLPGFTPISMFPKLWEASGLPYARLIERLVELAIVADRGAPPSPGGEEPERS